MNQAEAAEHAESELPNENRSFPKAVDGSDGGDFSGKDADNQEGQEAANEEKAPTRAEQILGQNPVELNDYIVGMVKKITEAQASRASINEGITAEMSASEAKGMNRKGVKAALAYLKLSESDRDAFLLTFRIVLEAMGTPIQKDLFLDTNQEALGSD